MTGEAQQCSDEEGIRNALIKEAGEVSNMLSLLFFKCLEKSNVPEDWTWYEDAALQEGRERKYLKLPPYQLIISDL